MEQFTEPATPASDEARLAPGTRPNILLIVADDLGYTDLGVLGGEIGTPNLDALARSGILFTNFHAAATCSPTRAMLLSGTDHHLAGLGNMAESLTENQRERRGYEGHLSFRVASLAELLRDAGYHTYMTGKWHLGLDEQTSPAARGFEKSFVLLEGGGGHFSDLGLTREPAHYREDGRLTELPSEFYSTKFYAERLIEYLDSNHDDGRPFFAYLAFTAPHWPLQAPDASIAKYRGRYDEGYDRLHAQRMERFKQLGVVPHDIEPFPRLPDEPPWEELGAEERRIEARKMEVYAAMVHDVDVYVGKVIDYLEHSGQRDNTLIIFLSDNGAEGHRLNIGWPELAEWVKECCDNSLENMGRPDSYIYYGPNWARVSTGPYRMFKGFTAEGGIRVPAFVSHPALANRAPYTGFASVMDVMPTLLELAGVRHPGTSYKGRRIEPMRGVSLLPVLLDPAHEAHAADYVMGWELFGKRALRRGHWKVVFEPEPYWSGRWQLYNLADDPAELHDLAAEHPEKLLDLTMLWEQYATETGVVLPATTSPY
jgi:arylsulfatase